VKTPTEAQAIGPTPTEGCDCPGCTGLLAAKRFVRVAVAEAHDTMKGVEERQAVWWMALEVCVAELAARGVPGSLMVQTVAHAFNDEIAEQEEKREREGGLACMKTKGSA
jgi:hypothetical protein